MNLKGASNTHPHTQIKTKMTKNPHTKNKYSVQNTQICEGACFLWPRRMCDNKVNHIRKQTRNLGECNTQQVEERAQVVRLRSEGRAVKRGEEAMGNSECLRLKQNNKRECWERREKLPGASQCVKKWHEVINTNPI